MENAEAFTARTAVFAPPAPTVQSVALVSSPTVDADNSGTADTYKVGDVVRARVTFDRAVDAAGGPVLSLRLRLAPDPAVFGDTGQRNMALDTTKATANTTRLEFTYTIAAGDRAPAGIAFGADPLLLGHGPHPSDPFLIVQAAIRAAGTTVDADLSHPAIGPNAAHKVDGVAAEFSSAEVDGDTLTVTFAEPLNTTSTPAGTAFTVNARPSADSPQSEARDITGTATAVAISGATVTVTLRTPVLPEETLAVRYAAPAANPLRDATGNPIPDLAPQPATNITSMHVEVLVSNTGQPLSGAGTTLDQRSQAIGFTTGDNRDGYVLTELGVLLRNSNAVRAAVWTTDASGAPDTSLYVLTAPDTFTPDAVNFFTAPDDATLEASTTYSVVLNAVSATNSLPLTGSDAEDADGASGWSIADVRYWSPDDADWRLQRSGGSQIPAIEIRGEAPDVPRIILTVDDDTIAEGETATTVKVTATFEDGEGRTEDINVVLSLEGSADSPADYTTDEVADITITAGQTSGFVTFDITPVNDRVDDDAEEIIIGGSATDYKIAPATITITDNDDPSSKVILSVSPATLTENGGERSVTVEAELDDAVESSDVTVTLELSGTAGSGDYTVSALSTITIPMGDTSASETFDFTPTPDDVEEGDETITVGGSASGGLDLDSADITITDDPADVVTLKTIVLSANVGVGRTRTAAPMRW